VVLIGAAVLFSRFFLFQSAVEPAPPPTPPPTDPPVVAESQPASQPEEEGAVVAAARGQVELLSTGQDWAAASVGSRLGPEDAIRTGPGAEADLRIGDKSTITVAERSQLAVREVTSAARRFTLRKGRIAVDYKEDGARTLRIEDEKGDAVAATAAAKFSVLSSGDAFVVAAETGVVNLGAAGNTTAVKGGETSFVTEGAMPAPASPITRELLLKVASARKADEGVCAVIKGSTDPGAEVLIDGEPIKLDDKGRFSIAVASQAGKKGVRVTTRDAAGREREKMIACRTVTTPDREPPIEGMGVRWRVEDD